MTPPAAALSLLGVLLAAYLLLAYPLRVVTVKARLPGLGAALAFLAVSAFPLVLIYGALRAGMVDCLSNSCHGRISYSRDEQPAAYWLRLSILFVFAAPMFSMALQYLRFVLTHWGELPNRGLSDLALRERDRELEGQQSQIVDEKLLQMRSGGEIADAVTALALQRAQITNQLRYRENIRKSLQPAIFWGGILVLGIVVVVAVLLVIVTVNPHGPG